MVKWYNRQAGINKNGTVYPNHIKIEVKPETQRPLYIPQPHDRIRIRTISGKTLMGTVTRITNETSILCFEFRADGGNLKHPATWKCTWFPGASSRSATWMLNGHGLPAGLRSLEKI
ncbi:hypothetical protein C4546_03480 [Candidatus Parcubacteria bacterium]|jgi:hypothetical protein|nr:MAG: hypothetical protein C4546_03480 [Candidatus Parcubacteria bacterium]